MSITYVYITFLSLLGVLIILSTYFISSLISRYLSKSCISRTASYVADTFKCHMESYPNPADLPLKEIKKLQKITSSRLGLEVFTDCFREFTAKHGYTDNITAYAALAIDYTLLLKSHILRNKYRRSFILYLLAEYRVNTDETNKLCINSLNDASMYVRNNAMTVIKNTGNASIMVKALKYISKSERYFNDKMIIDFLDTFNGNAGELTEALLGSFNLFSINIKRLLPNYFTNQKTDTESVRRLMISYINGDDVEMIIGASKYFGWVTDERAGKAILQNLEHKRWEVRALSARVSQRGYDSPDMTEALELRISDSNWHVRLNSAFALFSMSLDEEALIHRVINSHDKYAREITLYVMFVKRKIDYNKYLELIRGNDYIVAI